MAEQNTRELSGVDPERQTKRRAATRELMEKMMQRTADGESPLGLTLFPTHAYAAEAEMAWPSTRTSTTAPACATTTTR